MKKKYLVYIIGALLAFLIAFVLSKITTKENNKKSDIVTTTTTTTTTTITSTTSTTTTTKTTTSTKKTSTTTKKEEQTTTKVKETSTGDLTGTSSKGYKIEYKNGAYYVDGYLIANKTYTLTSDWVPTNTHKKITADMDGFCRECIDEDAYKAWQEMQADAASVGYNMWIQSGYRGYYYQRDLYNGYVKRKGQAAADKSSARAGSSEHQTGLAFDICVKGYSCISSGFNGTSPANWLAANCYKYGYILRYPEGKTNETGYIHESWHFRYVGKELAKNLYNDGNWITMEDYFGIDSKYRD